MKRMERTKQERQGTTNQHFNVPDNVGTFEGDAPLDSLGFELYVADQATPAPNTSQPMMRFPLVGDHRGKMVRDVNGSVVIGGASGRIDTLEDSLAVGLPDLAKRTQFLALATEARDNIRAAAGFSERPYVDPPDLDDAKQQQAVAAAAAKATE